VKGPIGRIGKPIDDKEYLYFEVNTVGLYLEKNLLEELPEKRGRIKFLMGDYGTWSIQLKCNFYKHMNGGRIR
jgi:hypothetical protein